MTRRLCLALAVFAAALLAGCAPAPEIRTHVEPEDIVFSGERALEIETGYVTRFPNRDSGRPNNRLAAEWFAGELTALGFDCELQEWEVVNYSRTVPLVNAVCRLEGTEPGEILVVAHHDQSPDTIQGADNDGSGIAILVELAEILASEGTPRRSLVFVSTDGEEYGMLGSGHYVETHPDTDRIIAALSLDNLGKRWFSNVFIWQQGQFKGFGPLWLVLLTREAARAAQIEPVPLVRSPIDQILDQAVPVSFWDQGPIVAAGVPAVGIGGWNAPEDADEVWRTYHSPDDTLEYQSAETLERSGRVAEAFIRELLARDDVQAESGPYLYFDETGRVLRGLPLGLIFTLIPAAFLLAAVVKTPGPLSDKAAAWRAALPNYLAFWLPLFGGVLLTYLLVAAGLMDQFHLYPATPRDEPIYEPRWPAVALFLAGLGMFFWLAQIFVRRRASLSGQASFRGTAGLACLAIGLASLYILAISLFSLLFFVPLLFWMAIGGRRGAGRLLDLAFFLLGGLVVYALVYFFGFVILRNNWAVLWYLLMMFAIRMIGWPVALAITAVVGAGLLLIFAPEK